RGGQGGDHGHLAVNQFGCQGRQPIVLIFGPTIFDCDVPALSKASLAQASKECGYRRRPLPSRCTAKEPDHGHRRLLRARRERPRRHAAEQRHELAALHSITSSARASSVAGTSRPSALAVVRLIARSNFVGCSTGSSLGFAPFNILST